MPKKQTADPVDELTVAEREAMLDVVARIYIGMRADLERLKNRDAAKSQRAEADA